MQMTQLWPSLIALLPLVAALFTDAGQAWLMAHPNLFALAAALNTVVANLVTPKKPA